MKHHTENKKLLIVIPRFLPIVGGAEIFTFRLSRMLRNNGIDILVLTSRVLKDCPRKEIIDGITVVRIGKLCSRRAIDWVISLPYFILKESGKFNAILIVGVDFHVFSAIIGKFLGKKIFIRPTTGREDFLLNIPDSKHFLNNKIYNWLFKISKLAMIKIIPIFVDRWIAISRELEKEIKDAGVNKEKIAYIPNGVDTNIFFPVDETIKMTLRKLFLIPLDATVLMFCGRFVKRKGINLLLTVFKTLSVLYPKLHLFLVGSGEYQTDSIEEYITEFKDTEFCRNRITWIANGKHIPRYYQASDIFIFPSQREGSPNALLEAMASELLCICSAIGGIEDLIEDSKNGILFPAGNIQELQNTIVKALEHRESYKQITFNARQTIVKHYDIKVIAEAYKNLFLGRETIRTGLE